jgi:hypothetical protein
MPLSFDSSYYLEQYPDVKAAVDAGTIESAEAHWEMYGAAEGRNPNAVFNTKEYLAANPDVAASGMNPLTHFLQYGAAEGRAPSAAYQDVAANFDNDAYLAANSDVAAAVQSGAFASGYEHWVEYGQFEDARSGAQLTDGTPVSEVLNPSPAFTLTAGAESVNEGEAVSFQITGADANTEYVYKVTGVEAADIDEDAIAIVTTDENGEATIMLNVTADALTEGEQTINLAIVGQEATASVDVVDASQNTAPEVAVDQAFDIAEDTAAGAVVGSVAASDADNDDVTYAIASGNDAGFFAIDQQTGEVTLTADGAAALDAEADVTSYDLGVVAVDSKGATSDEQTVTVKVTDVNDNAPVLEPFETAEVAENTAAGAVVASAAATDADANDALTYSITAGNDDGLFAIDAKTGEVTLAEDAPSFEDGTTQFTLTVEASDGQNAVSQDLSVDLTDVNEAPVIENAEMTAVDAADGGKNDQFLTQTATVSDPEGNFNGGSITIDVDGYILKAGALSLNGTNFTLSGGKIIADSSVIEGDSDAFIGSYTLGGETDLDTDDGAGQQKLGVDQITITFDSDKVSSATVQELLRDIRISDPTSTGSTPADAQAKVTVTVADADGESANFSRVVDATGAMTVAGLDDDSQEVQVAKAENVAIDNAANAAFTTGGAEIDGMTVTVTSSVAGDALHLENQTGNPSGGEARVVDDQLLFGASDTIIGTVSGIGTDSVTFTLNGDATQGQIDALLQQVQVDLDTDTLGDRTVTTEIVSGDGLDTITGDAAPSATLSLVGDFVAATVNGNPGAGDAATNALALSTILAATDQAPVALNGNTYISVSGTYAAADIDQLKEDGALTIADGAVIRFVTDATADLQGVTGLNSLGSLSFGTAATPLDEDLTITAAQADGNSGIINAANKTLTVSGVQDDLNVNLADYSVGNTGGSLAATASLAEDATFTGTLGSFPLDVTSNTHTLEVSTDTAAGKTITSDGDISVTGVDGDFAGDLSKLDSNTAVNIAFDADTTLNADANLAANNVAVTVAQNQTLTLTADQATQIQGQGTVSGDPAVGDGNTGGSIAVTLVDNDATQSGVQPAQFNLGALSGGDIAQGAVNATRGQVTVAVDENTQITTGSDFANAQVTVANGVTLSGDAADLVTGTVTGAGNVTAALGTAVADLSTIGVTGEQVAEVSGTITLAGNTNLGDFTTDVAEGAKLTLTAAQADGKTITGADTTADGNNGTGGSVVVTGLDATSGAVNLANIAAGAASEQNDTAGTLTVQAQGDLDDDANLGDFQVEIASGQTLTLTEAQASGRVIGDATNTGNLTVVGLEADTDLSKVDIDGNLIVNVADGASVDVSANSNFGQGVGTVGGTSTVALTDSVLTLTAAQANGLTITGADGADDDDGDGNGSTGTEINDSQLIIAGDVAEGAIIDLTNVADNANLSFGDDNAIAVANGAKLTLTQDQADGVSINGDGDVVISSFDATSKADFSNVTASATAQLAQTATLVSGTQLGTVTVEAGAGETLTLNASQVGDADFTGNGSVSILGTTTNGDVLDYSGESWDVATLTVDGKQGNDAITGAGSVGKNVLKGGVGDDELTTGTASDELTGGDGIDTFNVLDGDKASITDFDVDTDYLNIAANGEATVNTLGVSGNFSSSHVVNNGTLNINGTSGIDVIKGAAGADTITGGAGADTITGGAGDDALTGGEGADTFVYSAATESDATTTDSITDFVGGADEIAFTNAATFEVIDQSSDTTISNATDLGAAVTAAYALANVDNDGGIEAIQFTYGDADYFAVEGAATDNESGALVINVTGVTGTVVADDFVAA